ncbi:MAG: hypothetical protein RMY28_000515 [Nostoc sp. ChiSLP01]
MPSPVGDAPRTATSSLRDATRTTNAYDGLCLRTFVDERIAIAFCYLWYKYLLLLN